jgi:UDP-N-acetylmuramoyl-L-alanyl-D-glutamate--2,6-diaminopimelate ligase
MTFPSHRLLHGQPLDGAAPAALSGVSRDSRKARAGELFVAVGGDARANAADAVAHGAAAVLAERPLGSGAPELLSPDARWSFAKASAVQHGLDRRCPPLLGVTGTKGKSTTVHAAWWALGSGAARVGTLGLHDGAGERPASMTTPPPAELHPFLAGLADGCPGVAIEVSSHAGDQQRLAGLSLAALAFTGLGRDHLDYHDSIAEYLAAKLAIVRLLRPGARCIINADDPRHPVVAHAVRAAGGEPLGLGFTRGQVRLSRAAGAWRLRWEGADHLLPVALPGRFNAFNAACGALLANALGVPLSTALARLADQPPVPGRLELLAAAPATYVDYAHTAESITAMLEALREHHPGRRLVCVFGCGGDRDRGKRGPMGRAAIAADVAVLTTDNSRSEDPARIAADVIAGLPPGACVHHDAGTVEPPVGAHLVVQPDRGAAIRLARRLAGRDGVVVVAGKGHETTQTIQGRTETWDDRAFVRGLGGP